MIQSRLEFFLHSGLKPDPDLTLPRTPYQILCVLQKSERTKENAFKHIRDDDIDIIMSAERMNFYSTKQLGLK